MTTVVACALAAGLVIEYAGTSVKLNGPHVGVDPEALPKNGVLAETAQREGAFGLTVLEGDDEAAFLEWAKEVTTGPDGKKLQHPFAPIASGALVWAKTEKDARAEARKSDIAGVGGLDPDKDLPADVEKASKKD